MSVKHMAADPALVRPCPTCGIQFRNLSKLHQHERKQHQGTVACQHCGKIFKNKVPYRYCTLLISLVPDLWHVETDPDPWIRTLDYSSGSYYFRRWLSRWQQKMCFFQIFCLLHIVSVRLHQSSKIKSHLKVTTKQLISRFNFLLLVIEGSGFRSLQIL